MDIQQLRYFKIVVQVGKISEAAEILNISAPALSTSISRLEKELNTPLFDRTNNRIILNEQGEIFLRYTEQILNAVNCAKTDLLQSKQAVENHLHITYTGTAVWSGLLTAFMQEHPEIDFSCSSTNAAALRADGLPTQSNLILSTEEDMPINLLPELESIYLFDNAVTVLLNTSHPLANETLIKIPMLANENLLLPSPTGFIYHRLKDLFYIHNLSIPRQKDYPYLTRRQMVAKNLGISFSSRHNTTTDNLPIRVITLDDPIGPIRTSLFWRKSHKLTKSEQVFVEFTKQYYSHLNLH